MANTLWRKLTRLQRNGMAFVAFCIVVTLGIMILGSFHPIDPNRRAGLSGGSEGFIVVGVVLFFIGKHRRNPRPDGSSKE